MKGAMKNYVYLWISTGLLFCYAADFAWSQDTLATQTKMIRSLRERTEQIYAQLTEELKKRDLKNKELSTILDEAADAKKRAEEKNRALTSRMKKTEKTIRSLNLTLEKTQAEFAELQERFRSEQASREAAGSHAKKELTRVQREAASRIQKSDAIIQEQRAKISLLEKEAREETRRAQRIEEKAHQDALALTRELQDLKAVLDHINIELEPVAAAK